MERMLFTSLCVLFMSVFSLHAQKNYQLIYGFEEGEHSSEVVSKTIEVLNSRLQQISSDFEVSIDSEKQIVVEIKTFYDQERLNSIITNEGKLELWDTFKTEELLAFLKSANDVLKKEKTTDSNPLFDIVSAPGYSYGAILFNAKTKDTATINTYLKSSKVQSLLTDKLRFINFLWGISDIKNSMALYAIKSNANNKAFITGENITDAKQIVDVVGRPSISIEMDADGAKRWERMTENAYHNQSQIAIVINDIVYSAPSVSSGPIKGGRSEISGNFTLREAQDLAIILKSSQPIPKLKLLKYEIIE